MLWFPAVMLQLVETRCLGQVLGYFGTLANGVPRAGPGKCRNSGA